MNALKFIIQNWIQHQKNSQLKKLQFATQLIVETTKLCIKNTLKFFSTEISYEVKKNY